MNNVQCPLVSTSWLTPWQNVQLHCRSCPWDDQCYSNVAIKQKHVEWGVSRYALCRCSSWLDFAGHNDLCVDASLVNNVVISAELYLTVHVTTQRGCCERIRVCQPLLLKRRGTASCSSPGTLTQCCMRLLWLVQLTASAAHSISTQFDNQSDMAVKISIDHHPGLEFCQDRQQRGHTHTDLGFECLIKFVIL